MIGVFTSPTALDTKGIPYPTAQEAHSLLLTELERFLNLVEKLDPDDWSKPTACTEWNVRDMLAHQSAGYAGGASFRELIHQLSSIPRHGQLPEDAINIIQLRDRAGKSPAELIAELRQAGPVAAENWAYRFRFLKLISIPHPVAGKLPLRHLMWVTHSRDTWMHRLDICRATGHVFEQTTAHDGRITALVMRDVADSLSRNFSGPALIFELSGIAGGTWKLGAGEPAATVHMDVLEFNIFASGRYSYAQARPMANITGDVSIAEKALQQILVVY
jgi:uncharacterized protein (TIGR03083 family)